VISRQMIRCCIQKLCISSGESLIVSVGGGGAACEHHGQVGWMLGDSDLVLHTQAVHQKRGVISKVHMSLVGGSQGWCLPAGREGFGMSMRS
jgi:hypothetical protein